MIEHLFYSNTRFLETYLLFLECGSKRKRAAVNWHRKIHAAAVSHGKIDFEFNLLWLALVFRLSEEGLWVSLSTDFGAVCKLDADFTLLSTSFIMLTLVEPLCATHTTVTVMFLHGLCICKMLVCSSCS